MPGRLRTPLALLSCLCALALATPVQAAHKSPERRLVARINDARAAHGLRQLKVRSSLHHGAHAWSSYLMRADSFYHGRLSPGTGEIIAWGTCEWFRPRKAVRMWLNSSPHRVLLLRPSFHYVGTGWTRGAWRGYGCVEMAVARFR